MYTHTTKITVRYGEVDAMGVVYYGNYAQYFEVARVEAIRNLGVSYKSIEEDMGVILPVTKFSVKYIRPAEYDDQLTIVSTIPTFPDSHKLIFHHKIFIPEKYQDTPLTIAEVTLYTLDRKTKRPSHLPQPCLDILKPYFNL